MLLTLCACSSNESADSLDLETQYYNYAQQCISEGKTDEAKSVLEEGITNTGSEKLQNLLDELSGKKTDLTTVGSGAATGTGTTTATPSQADGTTSVPATTQTTASTTNSFSAYVGLWYSPVYRDGNGGYELNLEIQTKDDQVALVLKQYNIFYPSEGLVQIKKVISASEMKDNTLNLIYDDDGNGNAGTIEMLFIKDRILCCATSDGNGDEYTGFFFDGEFVTLVKEETAEDLFN